MVTVTQKSKQTLEEILGQENSDDEIDDEIQIDTAFKNLSREVNSHNVPISTLPGKIKLVRSNQMEISDRQKFHDRRKKLLSQPLIRTEPKKESVHRTHSLSKINRETPHIDLVDLWLNEPSNHFQQKVGSQKPYQPTIPEVNIINKYSSSSNYLQIDSNNTTTLKNGVQIRNIDTSQGALQGNFSSTSKRREELTDLIQVTPKRLESRNGTRNNNGNYFLIDSNNDRDRERDATKNLPNIGYQEVNAPIPYPMVRDSTYGSIPAWSNKQTIKHDNFMVYDVTRSATIGSNVMLPTRENSYERGYRPGSSFDSMRSGTKGWWRDV